VFHLNIAKVDLGWIAYVAMAIYACCKCIFQVFQLFQTFVSSVDLVLHMLQWLYMHVSNTCFKCSSVFRHILQMFHLDISKAYVMLQAAVRLLLLVCRRGSRAGASTSRRLHIAHPQAG
jgi:hypothetical protein